ncbi:Usp domain-containing protein [Psidium guajava]|nr:Usp domain-containing protein [Psidium guajava]
MLTLKHVTKTKTLLLPQSLALDHALLATAAAAPPPPPSAAPFPHAAAGPRPRRPQHEGARAFLCRVVPVQQEPLFDRIFEILGSSPDGRGPPDLALSLLGFRLTERLVLDVLDYRSRRHGGVLPCLKFFDWAGCQHGFYYTRATFHAIFKILSTAKLMSLMIDSLAVPPAGEQLREGGRG